MRKKNSDDTFSVSIFFLSCVYYLKASKKGFVKIIFSIKTLTEDLQRLKCIIIIIIINDSNVK